MTRKRFFDWSKYLALAIVLVSLPVLVIPASVVRADSVVTFPDGNLEAAIRVAIEKPSGDIYESDISELGLLEASEDGIADLSGMEACQYIHHAWLDGNQIGDLSPLSNVSGGDHLFLGNNKITDVSPLSGIEVADVLSLSHNQISDLSGLSSETLDLSYNQIGDLSGLSGSRAELLDLSHNQVTDIAPLVNDPTIVIRSTVDLTGNPLNNTSITTYIPALQAREIVVLWDAPANQYPNQPINSSPANGATGISLTPTLQGSTFADPDAGDTHAASRWQVRSTTGDYDSPVWDSGSTSPSSSITVPTGEISPSTTYFWRVGYRDSRNLWSSYSRETSFTTADATAIAPVVATAAASGIGSTSATLNLTLTGLGSAPSVQVSFEWGPGTAYGSTTTPQTMTSTGSYRFALTGLAPATAYHFRSVAQGDGIGHGSDMTFTTGSAPLAPPQVTTSGASGIGSTSAALSLSLGDLGSASSVQVSFEWGLGTAYGSTTTPQAMTSTGSYSFTLSGLSPATAYHFRAMAEGAGISYGSDLTFTTGSAPAAAPAVTTISATGTGMDVATLNGALTGLGSAASVQVSFEWGLTAAYGNTTPATAMAGTGNFSKYLSGLAAGTTYHFRAKAVGDDTANGSDMTFMTSATTTTPPVVTTGDADGVTGNSARLNSNLTSMGTAASVTVSFVWGTTSGGPYPNETIGAAQAASGAFNFDLSGLASGTTFYYQVRAVGDGTSYGVEKSFTTSGTAGGVPVVGSLVANNGRPGDELTVTITGSNLTGATAVGFGAGITVSEFRVVTDTEITVKIAIGSEAESGKRDVTVTTPSGTAASPGGFEVSGTGSRVHLWVYLVAVAGGLVGLGLLASLGVWLKRRLAKPGS